MISKTRFITRWKLIKKNSLCILFQVEEQSHLLDTSNVSLSFFFWWMKKSFVQVPYTIKKIYLCEYLNNTYYILLFILFPCACPLFRNEMIILNLMPQKNASWFATFMEFENPCIYVVSFVLWKYGKFWSVSFGHFFKY